MLHDLAVPAETKLPSGNGIYASFCSVIFGIEGWGKLSAAIDYVALTQSVSMIEATIGSFSPTHLLAQP